MEFDPAGSPDDPVRVEFFSPIELTAGRPAPLEPIDDYPKLGEPRKT